MSGIHHVQGYDGFLQFIRDFKSEGKPVNVLFTGQESNGQSWCEDCEIAKPFIKEALDKYGENTHFIYVDVGDRPTWKDTKNPFRTNADTHLQVIPTLIRWKNPQRLEGEQLLKPELLQMFFTDED